MRLTASALVALLVLPVLSGCVEPGPATGARQDGQGPAFEAERMWAAPSDRHVASLALAAPRGSVSGPMEPTTLGTLALVPAGDGPGNLPSIAPVPPEHVLLEGAVLDGERGLLVLPGADGLAVEWDEHDVTFPSVRWGSDGLRAELPTRWIDRGTCPQRVEAPPCSLGRLPEAYANVSGFSGFDLPSGALRVKSAGGAFLPDDGGEQPVGTEVALDGARLLLFAHPGAVPGYDVALDSPFSLRAAGDLTLHAPRADGGVDLGGRSHSTGGAPFEAVLRTGARLSLAEEGAEVAVTGTDVHLADLRVGGLPRLEARLVALPELLDVRGGAGNKTELSVLLVETSGGAAAHVAAWRVEGDLDVEFVGTDDFVVTDALLDLARDVAEDGTHPLVTAPLLLGLGVVLPWVAFAEAWVAVIKALLGSRLEGSVVEPGGALVAKFRTTVPETARRVDLVIEGANFAPVRVTLDLRPSEA